MSEHFEIPRGLALLLGGAAIVILVGGMQAADSILVPVLLAAFLSVIGSPLLFFLQRRGVPDSLSVLVVVVGMLAILLFVGVLLGGALPQFSSRLPYYEARLDELTNSIMARFAATEELTSVRDLLTTVDPGAAWGLATGLLNSLTGVFGNAFLIIFTVVFMLLEASELPAKLAAAVGDSRRARRHLTLFVRNLNRYLRIKTLTSAATGACVLVWLIFLDVDFPLLWALLAFLLNFIPTIGSIIAAVPAVLLALVQQGWGGGLAVAIGYLVVNVLIGNLIEPRVMGRGLGLSTLVVFLSLLFWGFVFGPVGMLLAVPLTMTLKIALESSRRTRPYAILLGVHVADEDREKLIDDSVPSPQG